MFTANLCYCNEDTLNLSFKFADAQRELAKMKAESMKVKAENTVLKKKIEALRFANKNIGKMFSPAQRQVILGSKKVNWSTQDIVNALSIRSISPKCYDRVKSTFNLPLPAMRTLRTWTYKFSCEEGILYDVIKIMGQEVSKMDDFSRVAALCFDEMSIDSKSVLDPKYQCIVSHSKAQVVMLRGIFNNWKQAIFYEFNSAITQATLFDIITCVEDAGFFLCAVICDLGAENRSLLSNLQISTDQSCFPHPMDEKRNIYVLPDVPHCLKNLRNHILDDGVLLPDGTIIDREKLLQMAMMNGTGELKLCPSFSVESLSISEAERMRVRPAAQFFSHRMACLARKTFPNNLSIGKFFEAINDGFDVMNSRFPVCKKQKLKSGFGAFNISAQVQTLLELKDTLERIRFLTKKGNPKTVLLPCQAGFITSINSLLGLYKELKSKFQCGYILTARLNQDCLESFFGQIRGFSARNSHPTATEFRYRLKLVMLGSQSKPPKGSNVEDDGARYLAAGLLSLDPGLKENKEGPSDALANEKILVLLCYYYITAIARRRIQFKTH